MEWDSGSEGKLQKLSGIYSRYFMAYQLGILDVPEVVRKKDGSGRVVLRCWFNGCV